MLLNYIKSQSLLTVEEEEQQESTKGIFYLSNTNL